MTPNIADIRVYNLSDDTIAQIKKEFNRVILQAGYESNYGVIFQGNIKQVISGRESATDTFIDIIAGDGDRAYNFAIVNATVAAGATQADQIKAASIPMAANGVSTGASNAQLPTAALPRGKVMYGPAKNYLKNSAENSDASWSMQNEKIVFVSKKSYLPGQSVVITAKTGMIGTPQQTNEGINIKCLLNPNIKIGSSIKLDNKSVQDFKINLSTPNSAANIPPPYNLDGLYYPLVIEHSGDTRGVDWYSTIICLSISVTSNPANSVQVNYGG